MNSPETRSTEITPEHLQHLRRRDELADLMQVYASPAHECDCVLPSQSCPACRAAAREMYGDGIPF